MGRLRLPACVSGFSPIRSRIAWLVSAAWRTGVKAASLPDEWFATRVRDQDWSAVERKAALALIEGDVLDLSTADDRHIRAGVVRDLLRRRYPANLNGSTSGAESDPKGLRVIGAVIIERLDLDHIHTNVPLRLEACRLEDGISCCFASLAHLNLDGSTLLHRSTSGAVLDALQCSITHNLELRSTSIVGGGEAGAVRLLDAKIGGQLDLANAVLTNDRGPALHADSLTVGSDVRLMVKEAKGSGAGGVVRLLGAHIGGQLTLAGAVLLNDSGPALHADSLTVDNSALLTMKEAKGSGARGAVRLLGAHIGGQLTLAGAVLVNDSGPALSADRLTVDSSARLTVKEAKGSGERSVVRLVGAHIGGQLDLADAVLLNDSGPALDADGLTVDGDALLDAKEVRGSGEKGVIRLLNARIGGLLVGDFAGVVATGNSASLVLTGLTYQGVPEVGVTRWLQLLQSATTAYGAQPYRRLAAAAAADGHDADVRRILIAQREDQLARATTRRRDRAWGWITKVTLGYGYRPWLALLWLIAITLISAGLTIGFGTHGLYVKDHPEQRCTWPDRAVVGLDNALPLVATTTADFCLTRPSPNHSAQAVTWTGIGAQVGGWAFATLFVAGFTGAVRKT